MAASFAFSATLWPYEGPAAWYFVSLPTDVADDIADVADARSDRRSSGFGSVRVSARVGETTWSTSLFPDSSRGTYLLPVKKAVRVAEGLADGDEVDVSLTLSDS